MDTSASRFISWSVLGAGACVALLAVIFSGSASLESGTLTQDGTHTQISKGYTELARQYVTKEYNLQKAIAYYKKAVMHDGANAAAMYELARSYSVLGDYTATLALASRYEEKFPNDPKILYTAGLAAGFSGDYVKAEQLFAAYIEKNAAAKWQSRLDLAWAQYQQGEYAKSQKTILGAIEAFGENPWLNTSLSAVEHALGNTEAALAAVTRAEAGVSEIDINTWNTNYSFNGPAHYEKGISQMKRIIEINKVLIVSGKAPQYSRADFTHMAGFAPEAGKGIVVSACGESCGPQNCYSAPNSCGARATWQINSCVDSHGAPTGNNQTCATNPLPTPPVPERYGQSCTSINLCGIQATGTVQCDGRCSALAPLPNAFGQGCTIRNRCGSATGIVGCNGQCNVSRYPTCLNPDDSVTGGDDGWTEVTINDDGRFTGQSYGNIGVQISVSPSLVRSGQRTVVRWNSMEMSSCTVTGTNGDSWTGLAGEEVTRPITLRVTYTLSCTAFDGRTMTDTAIVGLAPVMCEIGQQGCEQQQ
jgi:tetratricopeptide (TPR) repeat protein